MKMEHHNRSASPQPVSSVAFYGLAVITLGLGSYVGIACLTARGALQPIVAMLQLPLVDLLVKPLINSLSVLGIVVLLATAGACALLIAFGRLLARAADLARRVDRLETAFVQLKLMPDCPALDEAREQVLDGLRTRARP